MVLTIQDAGIETQLYRDPNDQLLALDASGQDRMGLVDRTFLHDTLTKHDMWERVPVYSDPDATPDI